MFKRKDAADSQNEPAGRSNTETSTGSGLPSIESPSISPASHRSADSAKSSGTQPPQAVTGSSKTGQASSLRRKRSAALVASAVFAAAFGAVIGATANTYFAPPATLDTASIGEQKAMQQTLGQLLKQMTTLNTASIEAAARAQKEIAALRSGLDAANKSNTAQFGKLGTRLDHMEQLAKAADPVTTGSIRPRHAASAAKTAAAEDPAIVHGWVVRATRNGLVYVEGRSGIYRVLPGVSLPGLGTVETIKREDGRWIVVTPKGNIVSMRDRPYFRAY